jgi:type VI secretion system secreted protein VgrG
VHVTRNHAFDAPIGGSANAAFLYDGCDMSGSDNEQGGSGGGNPADAISQGLGTVAGALGDSQEVQDAKQALKTASDVVNTASNVVGTAQQIGGAADALGRGDFGGALGSATGGLGNLGGATSALTDAAKYIVPEGEARELMNTVGQVARGVQGAAQAIGGVVGAVSQLGSMFGAGGEADQVSYTFEHEAFADHTWNVRYMRLEEALSEPYRAVLQIASEDTELDTAELLGRGCSLTIERTPATHRICGIVSSVEEASLRSGEHEARWTVEVVPALALLGLRKDTRMFQEMTVPEILDAVLAEALGQWDREMRLDLEGEYEKREYCLQYEETDLSFVQRLMEEEGISYSFEHEGEAEVLVLRDVNRSYGEVETLDDNAVPYTPDDRQIGSSEPIQDFHPTRRLVTTKTTLWDFDWTRQGSMRVEADQSTEPTVGGVREVYEHRRALTITDYDAGVHKYQAHDATRQAQVRHELHGRDAKTAAGVGRVIGFAAGLKFEMTGHPNVGADGEYLLTRVIHESVPLPGLSGASQRDPYHNRFECIPADLPFRPARRTPKPRIHSMQTAVVVGPAGEEIHTDEHGRIKVQFHWDRQGQNDDRSSCWMRVQQPWAGSGWGFTFIPRIDMEVVVNFIEGDPDRPLVVGSVYNGTNRPPYTLPDEKTKSTIKTNSSPTSGGYNELRFEDKAGSEEIYLQAEKDFNELVKNNHSTTVRANQTNTVHGKQTETVHKEQTMTVHKKRTKTVHDEEENTIHKDRTTTVIKNDIETIHEDRTLTVVGNETVHVQKVRTLTVDQLTRQHHKGARQVIVDKGDQLDVTADRIVQIAGKHAMAVTKACTTIQGGTEVVHMDGNIFIKSASKIELEAPGCKLKMEGGRISIVADNEITLSTGDSTVVLKSDGNIAAAGGAKVAVQGGGAIGEWNDTGVKLAGNMVEIGAEAVAKIQGTMVKIN